MFSKEHIIIRCESFQESREEFELFLELLRHKKIDEEVKEIIHAANTVITDDGYRIYTFMTGAFYDLFVAKKLDEDTTLVLNRDEFVESTYKLIGEHADED